MNFILEYVYNLLESFISDNPQEYNLVIMPT